MELLVTFLIKTKVYSIMFKFSKFWLLSVLTVISLSVTAFHAPSPSVQEKKYSIEDVEALSLDIEHANITITHNTSNTLNFTLKQTLKKGDAEQCLFHVKTKQDNNHLQIRTKRNSNNINILKLFKGKNCSVDKEVNIVIGAGFIHDIKLNFSHSKIEFENGQYHNVDLDIAHSSLKLTSLNSQKAQFSLAHSEAKIGALNLQELAISGAHSRLYINNLIGQVIEGHLSHGQIEITKGEVNKVNLKSDHGAIELLEHAGQDLILKGLHSKLWANTTVNGQVSLSNRHGSTNFIGQPKAIDAESEHGGIHIKLLNENTKSATAYSRHGSIKLSVPHTSNYRQFIKEKGHSIYSTSGAEHMINLNASHGNVSLNEY